MTSALAATMPPALLRALATGYVVGAPIGRGGHADVYRATRRSDGAHVAIKVRRDGVGDGAGVARWHRELELLRRFDHPRLVGVLDHGETGGLHWLVLPFVSGGSLADRIAAHGPLSVGEAVTLLGDLASALAAVHAAGVVHRDVTSANVFLTADGRAMLGDFGIATSAGATTLTETGLVVGTLAFLAPERLCGEVAAPPSDVFAFGVVAYQALSGRLPWTAVDHSALVARLVTEPAAPLRVVRPEVPRGLAQLVHRCLAQEAGRRPADGAALAAALDTAGWADATADRPAPVPPLPRAPADLWPAALLAGAGVALVAGQPALALPLGVAALARAWRLEAPPPEGHASSGTEAPERAALRRALRELQAAAEAAPLAIRRACADEVEELRSDAHAVLAIDDAAVPADLRRRLAVVRDRLGARRAAA
jgi:serine/threonine-protein kinase